MSDLSQPGSGVSTPGLVVSNVRSSLTERGPAWALRPVCWASCPYCGRPIGAGETVAVGRGGAAVGALVGLATTTGAGGAVAVGAAVGAPGPEGAWAAPASRAPGDVAATDGSAAAAVGAGGT